MSASAENMTAIRQPDFRISTFAVICFGLLLFAVLGSALAVIVTTMENRKQLAKLEALRVEARDMQVLWGQYLVEKSTWAAYGRVHDMATQGLDMQTPRPDATVILKVQ